MDHDRPVFDCAGSRRISRSRRLSTSWAEDASRPIIRLAVFVGFIGYTSALLTLVMDIGRPDRFWHPWVYWNIHSVLWEITWCITIYLTIMLLEFLPVIAELQVLRSLALVSQSCHIGCIRPLQPGCCSVC